MMKTGDSPQGWPALVTVAASPVYRASVDSDKIAEVSGRYVRLVMQNDVQQ
jgi:hypothetical protein